MRKKIGNIEINFNLSILHEKLIYEGFYDKEFNEYKTVLQTMINPIVFDLGANIGVFSVLFSCYCSYVHAFEPVKAVHRKALYNTRRIKNIKNNHLAVGDFIGTAKIDVSYMHNQGSTLNKEVREKFKQIFAGKKETVKVITLDKYCEENNIPYIDLLKIDVEGYEINVLKGATRLLQEKRINTIYYEVLIDNNDISKLLEKYGYTSERSTFNDAMYKSKVKKT